MKVNKFDFNDKLFELSDKIYVAPMCPARDGDEYNIGRQRYWCGYDAHYPGREEYEYIISVCENVDDLVKSIRQDHRLFIGRDRYYIYIKEAGKKPRCVAYIKAEDIK